MTTLFRKFLPAAVAVLLFFTLAALYFAPQFGGDVLPQHDVRQYEGASREIHRTREAYGEDPQWIGSMFGGMPAYLVDVRYPAQLVKDAAVPLTRAVPIPAGLIFFAMCAFWVMLRMMKIDPWVGIVPSLAYGLSTYFLLIIGAGHLTKMWALVYAPPMMGGIWMTLRGGRPGWGGALTALFASLEIGANHPQITYYFLLAAALFWLSEGIVALREKLLKPFAKRTAVLAAAGLLALGSNFAPLWYTAQHAKDTTRSGSELAAGDAGSGGLDLAYATAWSYGRAESWNLLIPDFMGSDSARAFSEDGPVAAALTPYGMAQAAQQLPAYWGEQPYTGGPTYLGAAALFLALLGVLLVGGRDRWWIVAASLVMLLLAWGHHFMGLTELAYKYLPGYNKFRTVSMALVVVQWTVPLLAALALQRLWCAELPAARLRRALAWAAGVTGGLCLLFAVVGGQLFDFGREAAVEQMGQGNFSTPVPEGGYSREVDELVQGVKAMAGELDSLYTTLEEKVGSRTRLYREANEMLEEQRAALARTNELLEQTNGKLAQENEYRTNIVAILSHELRTPLTSILAFVDLWEASGEEHSPESRECLEKIKTQSQVLLEMVNNALDMVRVESGALEFARDPVDVTDLAAVTVGAVGPIAEQKGVGVDFAIAREVPLIRGDWAQLEKILTNLLSNAVKFTGAGGMVWLKASYDGRRRELTLAVEDEGIGIAKERQEGIFDRFVQADASISRKYRGSGLGLSLVKKTAEALGGSVSVESEPGRGSTFTVTLPVTPIEEDEDEDSHC